MRLPGIEWGKVSALMNRDMRNWASYKMQIVIAILGALVGFASWGFNASFRNITFTWQSFQPTPVYTTTYVAFLVSGILVSNVVLSLTSGLTGGLRPWMLESILMTGIRPSTFVIGTVAWSYILSVVLFIPQLMMGIFFFKVNLDVNFLTFILSVLISGIIVFGISMASVGIRLVTKITDPVQWILGISLSLLSGQTFPVQYLNNYLPGISNFCWVLPYTWIFDIIRLSTLAGASIFDPGVAEALLISLLYAAILVPIGLYCFVWGLRKAKKQGTLGWW